MNRRQVLRAAGVAAIAAAGLTRLARADAPAAQLPPLTTDDPKARELQYVEDARQSPDPTHTCASCGLYQGSNTSVQGPCLLFPKRSVKAAGSCKSWAPQM
jgi:hypothetical protein